mgnify:CR=1
MYKVYIITNTHSNNIYIGQTRLPVEKCWKTHLSEATHLNKPFKLHQAIRKYGKSAFTISVLEDNLPDRATANAAEVSWIAALDSYRHGYNMTRGGQYNCGGNTERRTRFAARIICFAASLICLFGESEIP